MYESAYIYCPRPSDGATTVRNALREAGIRAWRLGLRDNRPPARRGLPLINWGATDVFAGEYWDRFACMLNPPEAVSLAVSKIKTYKTLFTKVPSVTAFYSKKDLLAWLRGVQKHSILARRDGLSGGEGINLFRWENGKSQEKEIPDADFYSSYFPKTHEFRVHVGPVNGGIGVIDMVEKKARIDAENIDRTIRTSANGWVFAHEDLALTNPSDIKKIQEACVDSVEYLGLDFGAVDVLVRLNDQTPRRLRDFRICEVNTSPGLENTRTIAAYRDSFLSHFAKKDA